MSDERDHFEATFVVGVDRGVAWDRLAGRRTEDGAVWLPGFDAAATLDEEVAGERLRATKADEPCAGTDIVVVLEDVEAGTRITVVQSRFGDWLGGAYDAMAVGWRYIVADLRVALATGVHPGRHLLAWGDLGADVTPADGGLSVEAVRPGTLAHRIGLVEGDLLVLLAGAPVSGFDDLLTALRVLGSDPGEVSAAWVRGGELVEASTAPA